MTNYTPGGEPRQQSGLGFQEKGVAMDVDRIEADTDEAEREDFDEGDGQGPLETPS